jgi:membrane fusion protein (multidrug efflux system)
MNDAISADSGTRKRSIVILAAFFTACGIAWLSYWFVHGRYFERTDDAYVSGDIIQISSEIPGTVTEVQASDTQSVARGQTLLELDQADARIAMNASIAELAATVREVQALYAQRDQMQALIDERDVQLARAEDDYKRRQSLSIEGSVSAEDTAHARNEVDVLRAGLIVARQQLRATRAQVQGATVAMHPRVLEAAAKVRNAVLALRRTRIISPVAGVVARRSVQLGQHIAAGAALMVVVPLNDVWVDANFKESQLEHVRVGQPVAIHADLYGGNVTFHGEIAGLSAGSGSAFALLPPQNATGNWIKIVQRVPVRIALNPTELAEHPLRVGLSMTAVVDVRDTSGPLVADRVRGAVQPTREDDSDDTRTNETITRIISANSEGAAGP